jgi:hypothetical protein
MDARSKNLFKNKSDARNLSLAQKRKLAKKAKPFTLKEIIMYKMGQDNKMHKCLTTLKAQILLKKLYEGVGGRHFATDITTKKILDVGYWWPTLFKDTHDFCKSCYSC